MLIKKEKQLKKGQIINYPVYFADPETGNFTTKNLDIVVIEIYEHHVLCRCINMIHRKVDITNADLYLHGIYKKEDFVEYINPANCLHGTQGGLKFFDKSV